MSMISLRLAVSKIVLRILGIEAPLAHYIHGADTLPPPLTREREAELLARLPSRDAAVRDELIEHNLRLVVYIARKYESSGIGVEDLISIGSIGLIKAINSFQPSKGIKLATYASRCIENEILMTLRKTHNLRHDISIDEPLTVDWDGNELLLSDILGTTATSPPGELRSVRSARRCFGPLQHWESGSVKLWSIVSG